MIESIQTILARKLNHKRLQDVNIVGIAQEVIGNRGQAISFRNNQIKIIARDQMVGFELVTNEHSLCQQMNQKIGKTYVHRLKVVVSDPIR